MADVKSTDDKVTVLAQEGTDIQIVYIKKSAAREYFDNVDEQPFGEAFDTALDEVQGATAPGNEGVLILVIQDDEA